MLLIIAWLTGKGRASDWEPFLNVKHFSTPYRLSCRELYLPADGLLSFDYASIAIRPTTPMKKQAFDLINRSIDHAMIVDHEAPMHCSRLS